MRRIIGSTFRIGGHPNCRMRDRVLQCHKQIRRLLTTGETSLSVESFGDIDKIVRHGNGDRCITLSVGGTRFTTLRSTVEECPVLEEHVSRAEKNKEILLDGAVFIDRDPKHFVSILKMRLDGKSDLDGLRSGPIILFSLFWKTQFS